MADTTARKVDAMKLPLGFGGPGGLARVQSVAGPILGAERVHVRHQGSYNFVTADPADTLLYPRDHALSGRDRYAWVDMGGGIAYGYLRQDVAPDAEPTLPPPPAGP